MVSSSGRVFLFASIVVLTGVMLAGCSGGGSSQSGAVPQGPSAPGPAGQAVWPLNDPNIPPLEDVRVTLAHSHPGSLPVLSSNGAFPALDYFATGRPPASTAGANDYEQVGIKIPTGGTYNGIYAEHTAYLPASFAQTYSHGGNSFYAPYDAIEGPMVRPNNGACVSSGTYAGNTGTGVTTYWGVLSWCGGPASEANATLGPLLPIDATFITNYVALNTDNLPVYRTQIFTTDNAVTSSSVWHIQLYNLQTSTWDEYNSTVFPASAASYTGTMQAPFGYSGYFAAHRSGQCPGGLPPQAGDNVYLHSGAGTPALPPAGWSSLAPTMTGLTTTVVSPTASMGCFNNDTNNPATSGAATNTFSVIHANNYWRILSIPDPGSACPNVTSSPGVIILGYYPCDLINAYNLPSVGGSGYVAIVDAFDDPNAEADMNVYRTTFGLPTCTTGTGCFQKLNQAGLASGYPAADPKWAGEISLDLDMVSAICPHCHVILVEANSASGSDLGASVLIAAAKIKAASAHGAISNSYGGPEAPGANGDALSNTSFYDQGASGITVVASAGDNAYAAGVQYPAASPQVVAVGGTTLYQDGSARGWSETVWGYPNATPVSGTGSGCSGFETQPAFQAAVVPAGCANRMINDVSAVADPNTGVAVYNTYPAPGGWSVIGGTSASAPIVAGIYGLINASNSTYAQSIYTNAGRPSGLHDVTSGTNGTCTTAYFCNAAVGYDGPTGNGTPNGICAFGAGFCPLGIARNPQSIAPAGAMRRVTSGPSEPICGPAKPGEYRCFAWRRTDIGVRPMGVARY